MSDLNKYKRGNYGFLTLTDVVDRYYMYTFQDGQKNIENIARIAADVWKKIYWNDLRVFKIKKVKIDLNTFTVKFPIGAIRIVGVDVIDSRGKIVPLFIDESFDTSKIEDEQPSGCGCKECNCNNPACGSISNTFIQEDVILNGTTYQRAIKTRVCTNGDVLKEVTEPFAVMQASGNMAVEYRTIESVEGSVEVKPCGCVVDAPVNNTTIFNLCGWSSKSCNCGPVNCDPTGYYKPDYDLHEIHIINCAATEALVHFVGNAEDCTDEILIPEYGVMAVIAGTYHYASRFRSTIGIGEKRDAQSFAERELLDFQEFLSPIIPHEFLDLQNNFHKW